MKKMKLIPVVFLCATCLCVSAMAQSPISLQASPPPPSPLPEEQRATTDQIETLLDVIRVKDQMATLIDLMPQIVQQQMQNQRKSFGGHQLTPEQEALVEKFLQQRIEKSLNLYPIDEVIADVVPIYQKYVSREHADALIEFYKTPAAQWLIDVQPAMVQEYLPLLMTRMETRIKEFGNETASEAQTFLQELLENH